VIRRVHEDLSYVRFLTFDQVRRDQKYQKRKCPKFGHFFRWVRCVSTIATEEEKFHEILICGNFWVIG